MRTFGLTHLALAVRDLERSLHFYEQVFGVEAYFREEGRIHVRTPGCHEVLTFDQHAGGMVLKRGEFAPGFPYAFVSDPDGYEVEIWFE